MPYYINKEGNISHTHVDFWLKHERRIYTCGVVLAAIATAMLFYW